MTITHTRNPEQQSSVFRQKLSQFLLLAGATFFGVSFFTYLATLCGFVVRMPVSTWQLYFGLGITLVLLLTSSTRILGWLYGLLSSLLIIVVFASTIMGALLLNKHYLDLSYDGQAYQQEAIIELSNGWNPLYSAAPTYEGKHGIWLDAYPKQSWVISSVLQKVTGSVETGKIQTLISMVGAFLIVFAALISIAKLKLYYTPLLALLFALNPVSLYQMTSYYIDGQLTSLIIALASLCVLIINQPNSNRGYRVVLYSTFVQLVVLLMNVKLVGFVYGSILLVTFVLYCIFRKRNIIKPMIFLVITSVILAIGVVGYNPYLTNTLNNGNILYPVFGTNAYNFKDENLPINLRNKTNLEIFAYSGFLESSNVRGDKDIAKLKIPFTTQESENTAFQFSNPKKGGFGVWFSGVILLCIIVLLVFLSQYLPKVFGTISKHISEEEDMLYATKWSQFGLLVFLLTAISASVAINSASTYARFVPQLWYIPILIILFGLLQKEVWTRVIVVIASILMLYNNYAITKINLEYQATATQRVISKLQDIKSKTNSNKPLIIDFKNATSTRQRLEDMGITYRYDKLLTCKNHVQYYIPENESDVCVP